MTPRISVRSILPVRRAGVNRPARVSTVVFRQIEPDVQLAQLLGADAPKHVQRKETRIDHGRAKIDERTSARRRFGGGLEIGQGDGLQLPSGLVWPCHQRLSARRRHELF